MALNPYNISSLLSEEALGSAETGIRRGSVSVRYIDGRHACLEQHKVSEAGVEV
jgi:hypothetical protein